VLEAPQVFLGRDVQLLEPVGHLLVEELLGQQALLETSRKAGFAMRLFETSVKKASPRDFSWSMRESAIGCLLVFFGFPRGKPARFFHTGENPRMADALDAKTFKALFDELFDTLSKHPEIGPKLRAQKTPQRFVITDLGLVLDVRDASDAKAKKGEHLEWVWGGKPKWKPVVNMLMTSDLANRYFQGRENIPLAIALKKIVLRDGRPSEGAGPAAHRGSVPQGVDRAPEEDGTREVRRLSTHPRFSRRLFEESSSSSRARAALERRPSRRRSPVSRRAPGRPC
jgi:hypothetical protein